MTRTPFDNISTGIEQKGDKYQVVLKIYNNTYYLEPVDTMEQAENIQRSINFVLILTYHEVFTKRLMQSTKTYMETYIVVFGLVVMYLIVSNIPAVPESFKLVMLFVMVVSVALYFLLRLKSIKTAPPFMGDDIIKSLTRDINKTPQ
jgi:hypothetical protein